MAEKNLNRCGKPLQCPAIPVRKRDDDNDDGDHDDIRRSSILHIDGVNDTSIYLFDVFVAFFGLCLGRGQIGSI